MELELHVTCGKGPLSHMSSNEYKHTSWKKDSAPKLAQLTAIHTNFTTTYLRRVFIFNILSSYMCN